MIAQGLHVIADNNTALIDPTERIDKSLFRLGLDWLKYALKKNIEFEPTFLLQPSESTVNVRKQNSQKKSLIDINLSINFKYLSMELQLDMS